MCADPDFDDITLREFSVTNQRTRAQRQLNKALDGTTAAKFMKKAGPRPSMGPPARQATPAETDNIFGLDGAADDRISYRCKGDSDGNNGVVGSTGTGQFDAVDRDKEQFDDQGTLSSTPQLLIAFESVFITDRWFKSS